MDAVSATIMKRHNPGLTDPQLRQLITAHIDDDSFCRYVIQQDINKIALDCGKPIKTIFSASRRTTHWKIFCRQPRKQSERAATQSRRP